MMVSKTTDAGSIPATPASEKSNAQIQRFFMFIKRNLCGYSNGRTQNDFITNMQSVISVHRLLQRNHRLEEKEMSYTNVTELFSWIKHSPTAFHAIAYMKQELEKEGYIELYEQDEWQVQTSGKYFVIRNQSSIIAFQIGKDMNDYSFHICASHSDSPRFKIKENAQIEIKGKYTQLNAEGYGGMICATWVDRPLSVAGRILVKQQNQMHTKLVNIPRDLVLIPSVAIHMNRNVNEGYHWNKQVDMLPLYGGKETVENTLIQQIAQEAHVDEASIYGMDLYLYNRMEPSIWGANQEYISAPCLDDLQGAFTTFKGFLNGTHDNNIAVFACFDNEEVGSLSKQGAESTFLYDILTRINTQLGKSQEDYHRALSSSMMLSVDNAHALHPNHPEYADMTNCVYMNEGIVIKTHAGQKYTSDALSISLFKDICEYARVPYQFYANRSDMAGGSTLGNLVQSQVSLSTIDIGLAQLAMHSAYETAGVKDMDDMIQAVETFYHTHFKRSKDDTITILHS